LRYWEFPGPAGQGKLANQIMRARKRNAQKQGDASYHYTPGSLAT